MIEVLYCLFFTINVNELLYKLIPNVGKTYAHSSKHTYQGENELIAGKKEVQVSIISA